MKNSNGKVKRFVALLLVVIMQISLGLQASAANVEPINRIGMGIDDEIVQPNYIVSCSHTGGIHLMDGRGVGKAYYGAYPSKDLRITGQASQCRYCHLVLVTENNPFYGWTTCWGDYAYWNPGYSVGNGVMMYTTAFGHSDSNSDAFVRGFDFN